MTLEEKAKAFDRICEIIAECDASIESDSKWAANERAAGRTVPWGGDWPTRQEECYDRIYALVQEPVGK